MKGNVEFPKNIVLNDSDVDKQGLYIFMKEEIEYFSLLNYFEEGPHFAEKSLKKLLAESFK